MEEHKRIKVNGEFIPVQWLEGESYKLYKGEKYFSRGRRRLHTDVWVKYNGEIPKGYHVHHVDGNQHNNDISNLNLVQRSLHLRYEGKKRAKENIEWFKRFHSAGIDKAKEWHASEEGRKWHSEHGKKAYAKRKAIQKTCKECGKIYETKHTGVSKYCHNNCKAKANRRERKERRESL